VNDGRKKFLARRRGSILIIAMVACFTISAMVLVLCRSMATEAIASANQAAELQAGAIERGGEQYVLGIISSQSTAALQLTDDQFDAIQIGDGWFWILRPQYDDASLPTFGLVDESSKLNLNTVNYNQLMQLPGMTDDVASSIFNWRSVANALPQGAQDNDYLSQQDGYHAKTYFAPNTLYETVEELLLVRGVTKQMLYGDGTETPLGQQSSTAVMSSGMSAGGDVEISRGLYDLLTIYSQETGSGGQRSVRLVTPGNRLQLQTFLAQTLGHAVIVPPGTYTNLYTFYLATRMSSDDFSKIFHSLTTAAPGTAPVVARVNVNTASPEVLTCLGLGSADVQKLISARASAGNDPAAQIGWVLKTLGNDAAGIMSQNVITDQPSRYSADILAVNNNGRAFKRVRIVVDTSGTTPQIIYRRDITDRRGWPMDPQLLATIRAGQFTGSDVTTPGATP